MFIELLSGFAGILLGAVTARLASLAEVRRARAKTKMAQDAFLRFDRTVAEAVKDHAITPDEYKAIRNASVDYRIATDTDEW